MTAVSLANGWVIVPYDGPDTALVELAVDDEWLPAFLDYVDGKRVAKVRPPVVPPTAQVRLRVDGSVSSLGWLVT